MTLMEFLETLDARPGEVGSPKLIVREDDLGEWDADTILNAPYDRAPYALLAGLARVPQTRTHHNGVKVRGALDVTLYQPTTTAGNLPDATHMANLAALIVRAPEAVTEISTGYPLADELMVVTETDPIQAVPGNPLRGRIAAIRFQYSIWR